MIAKKWLSWIFTAVIFAIAAVPECYSQDKMVEIFTEVDRPQFVGGQNIVLKASVVFNQKANPFWEELTKLNFSPFKLEKISLGERKMFEQKKDLSRDVRQATFLLSLPLSLKHGNYSIPSFPLNYSYLSGKDEIRKTAKSNPVKVKKVPIMAIFSLEKDVVNIGDISTVRLIIWHEDAFQILNYKLEEENKTTPRNFAGEGFERWLKSLEARGQKITDLSKPEFPNFKIIEKKSFTEPHGAIIKETKEYKISFYDLPGKEFQIPSFHIWYFYAGDPKMTPKEITTAPLAVRVNSIVSPNRRSIEWLKPPETISKKSIYYFGYGPLALGGLLFLLSGISIAAGIIRNRRKCDISTEICELPAEIYSRVLSLKDNQPPERTTVIKIRNEIFKMLGSMLKTPAAQSMAKTTSQMISLLAKSGFSENSIKELKSCFSELDTLIQTHQAGQDVSETKCIINRVLAVSEISKARKKKKKFLIF